MSDALFFNSFSVKWQLYDYIHNIITFPYRSLASPAELGPITVRYKAFTQYGPVHQTSSKRTATPQKVQLLNSQSDIAENLDLQNDVIICGFKSLPEEATSDFATSPTTD